MFQLYLDPQKTTIRIHCNMPFTACHFLAGVIPAFLCGRGFYTLAANDAASGGKSLAGFENAYRTACAFLANPYKLWLSPVLDHKRAVQRLLFPGRVAYCRNEGY